MAGMLGTAPDTDGSDGNDGRLGSAGKRGPDAWLPFVEAAAARCEYMRHRTTAPTTPAATMR